MKNRNQKVQSYFHRSAVEFDRLYNETGYFAAVFNRLFRKALYERTEAALTECRNSDASSLLDVGCGSGVNSVMFAEAGVAKVVGLDYADGMIRLATEKKPPELSGNISYVTSDFMEWESEERFDCVVALGVFDYLDEPRKFLEKMKSLASKKVMFSVPGKGNLRQVVRKVRYQMRGCPLFFYSLRELEDLLRFEGSSFRLVDIGSSGFLCVLDLDSDGH